MAKQAKAKEAIVRRKADADRRSTLIKVLVTTEERERFQAAADRLGMSLSTWLRAIGRSLTEPKTDEKPSGPA